MLSQDNNRPPAQITDAGLNMYVDTQKLNRLPLPVIDMDITKLIWHFDMPVWSKDGTDDWNLKPRDVISNNPRTSNHRRRVAGADTAFPILVTEYKGRHVIIDGVHRLVKTYQQSETTIKAKLVPTPFLSRKEFQSP